MAGGGLAPLASFSFLSLLLLVGHALRRRSRLLQ
jgi:hypothetical protein